MDEPSASAACAAASDAPSPAALRAQQQRTVWWLFAPPAALVGLRWVLQWQNDRAPQLPVLPLTPFVATQDVWGLLWPVLWTLLALCASVAGTLLAARRWGWRPVGRVWMVLWVAACVAGTAALLWRHLNVRGVQPLAPVQAQVLGSRILAPSARGPGGTQLVLRIDTLEPLQQVLIDDPQAAQWRPGQRLALQWARGRYSGWFVTGWQAAASPTTSP